MKFENNTLSFLLAWLQMFAGFSLIYLASDKARDIIQKFISPSDKKLRSNLNRGLVECRRSLSVSKVFDYEPASLSKSAKNSLDNYNYHTFRFRDKIERIILKINKLLDHPKDTYFVSPDFYSSNTYKIKALYSADKIIPAVATIAFIFCIEFFFTYVIGTFLPSFSFIELFHFNIISMLVSIIVVFIYYKITLNKIPKRNVVVSCFALFILSFMLSGYIYNINYPKIICLSCDNYSLFLIFMSFFISAIAPIAVFYIAVTIRLKNLYFYNTIPIKIKVIHKIYNIYTWKYQ